MNGSRGLYYGELVINALSRCSHLATGMPAFRDVKTRWSNAGVKHKITRAYAVDELF
jgi:hypothetical protein